MESDHVQQIAIRDGAAADHEAIVALSLAAWAPVFASIGEVLGEQLSVLLHGADWQVHQAREVRELLADPKHRVWVAEVEAQVVGFVAATVADEARKLGEVSMVAVAPAAQRRGTGRALTEHAIEWLRHAGMKVALIETGGDAGHAPARRVYEHLGFRPMPIAKYFRKL